MPENNVSIFLSCGTNKLDDPFYCFYSLHLYSSLRSELSLHHFNYFGKSCKIWHDKDCMPNFDSHLSVCLDCFRWFDKKINYFWHLVRCLVSINKQSLFIMLLLTKFSTRTTLNYSFKIDYPNNHSYKPYHIGLLGPFSEIIQLSF